jgi:hypothetical protein
MCHAAKSSVLRSWANIARVVFSFVHRVEFASEVFYVRFAKRSENFQKFFRDPRCGRRRTRRCRCTSEIGRKE